LHQHALLAYLLLRLVVVAVVRLAENTAAVVAALSLIETMCLLRPEPAIQSLSALGA
jgi:hypothetical protein